MKVLLGCWDTHRLNSTVSENLRKKTFYYTYTTVDTFLTEFFIENVTAERVLSDSFNDLVKEAKHKGADYLVVFPSGTIIFDPKILYQGFEEYIQSNFDLGGHIIDHGAQNPNAQSVQGLFGLHEQCLVLSKKLINAIVENNFVVNETSFFYEDNEWPDITRSEDNMHGVYTPLWIRSGSETTKVVRKFVESKFCLFYDLIKFTLKNNFSIGNLPNKFRAHRQYSYQLENPITFENNLETSLDDLEEFGKVEMPNGQREFFIRWKSMLNPDKGFWAYNTETTLTDRSAKVDCFVSVASGLMPWHYLANFDIQDNCKVIFVDVNEHCLNFQKYILENFITVTDDFDEIVREFKKLHPQLQIFGNPTHIDFSPLLPKIKERWNDIKKLKYEYYKSDIISLPQEVKDQISASEYPYVWFSNVLRYIPNLNTIYDESVLQAYLLELLRLNLNVKWKGSSITNYRTSGPNSAISAKLNPFYASIDHVVPSELIMKDIETLEQLNLFTKHRNIESVRGIPSHRGWSSFVVHGLGYDKTEGYEQYGYQSDNEAPYDFTAEAIEHCPNTMQWLKDNKFKTRYHRVRIMKLDPGGMVGIHNDNKNPDTWATNFAVNNPNGCEMHFWNRDWEYLGIVPWEDSKVFRIRIGYNHCVINKSDQPRYHIIIHGAGGWI